MADNVNNLILEQLRQIRADIDAVRSDVAFVRSEMNEGFANLGGRVDGVALLMTMLAGHVHGLEERIESLEARPA